MSENKYVPNADLAYRLEAAVKQQSTLFSMILDYKGLQSDPVPTAIASKRIAELAREAADLAALLEVHARGFLSNVELEAMGK